MLVDKDTFVGFALDFGHALCSFLIEIFCTWLVLYLALSFRMPAHSNNKYTNRRDKRRVRLKNSGTVVGTVIIRKSKKVAIYRRGKIDNKRL